ncbi:MDR family NADP-dependent oxidoreductase [Sphingomonas radiodurans]|uniref:MDR family NADP-dependent oxidoreductase n=1 Tax=Sphingomonas radiodurans TaxID=2890321 RepID=UPI001E3C260C|nr:NADP-dependent oxidoreductase [Sphingomonas radiodurans]WBH17998.1 NADP-dependent oxidoreductase [Sphingomonas radiodurans]
MSAAIREVVLRHAITDAPVAADFEIIERRLPATPLAGTVHVRLLWLGLDPYVGQTLRARHMGDKAPAPGESLPGESVAVVLASNDPAFVAGDHVVGNCGWAEEAIVPVARLRRVDPAIAIAEHLGVLGMPGLTAWAGMTQLAKVRAGDVFTVDAAAGVVAGTAGQIAKIEGATVVGIAGGPDKCAIATDRYGFDACVDYNTDGWEQQLPAAITVHFENVGQRVLDAVLPRLAINARMVLCGLAQHYGDGSVARLPVGPIIGKRAQIFGVVVYDYFARRAEWIDYAAPHIRDGTLVEVQDIAEGLAQAGAQIERVSLGKTEGRALVRIGG